MTITMLRHPFGAGQMAFKRIARAIWFAVGIKMQHDPRDFSPVGPLRLGGKKAHVRHNMLLVVHR